MIHRKRTARYDIEWKGKAKDSKETSFLYKGRENGRRIAHIFRTETAEMDGQIRRILQTQKEKNSRIMIPSSQEEFWQKILCFLQKGAAKKVTEHGLIAGIMVI